MGMWMCVVGDVVSEYGWSHLVSEIVRILTNIVQRVDILGKGTPFSARDKEISRVIHKTRKK